MKKLLLIFTPLCFLSMQSIFAATATCTTYPTIEFNRTSGTINIFPYTQTFNDTTNGVLFNNCQPRGNVAALATFRATTGNTDLVGVSPYAVNNNITITGSTANPTTLAAAKIWLINNMRIAFTLRSNNNVNPISQDILTLNTDYNIMPLTSNGSSAIINGESYFTGLGNNGTPDSAMRNNRFTFEPAFHHKAEHRCD